jgi:hypothetical protein
MFSHQKKFSGLAKHMVDGSWMFNQILMSSYFVDLKMYSHNNQCIINTTNIFSAFHNYFLNHKFKLL